MKLLPKYYTLEVRPYTGRKSDKVELVWKFPHGNEVYANLLVRDIQDSDPMEALRDMAENYTALIDASA